MQPRLVAVSYPSAADDGHRMSLRSQATYDEHFSINTSGSSRWLSLSDSWHGLRSHLPFQLRRRFSAADKPIDHSPDPWPDIVANNSKGYRVEFVDSPYTSKWQKLPQSLQERILQHLNPVESPASDSVAQQAWMSNLTAFQLSCKGWSEVAQRQLYKSIRLRSANGIKSASYSPATRILKLRQTLKYNPRLAILVRHLTLLPENRQDETREVSFSDLIASLVMACPKLEKLTTHYVLYSHSFSRFHHALATRTRLTQHTWVIGKEDIIQSRAGKRYRSGILSTQQTQLFLQHHTYWRNLETLNVISHNGRGILEHNLFISTLSMLPSLQNLHVSSFDANDFSDETLLSIPPLRSLRLERCLGVTEGGLCQWAESQAAVNIQRLVLESQNITSLLTISALFDSLSSLEVFRLTQLEFEPSLPLEIDIQEPLFSSLSLKTLEWYTANGQDVSYSFDEDSGLTHPLFDKVLTWPRSKSSQHLLSSVLDYGFPQLQQIILPGYDNLAGLLRWLRHSSWVRRSTLKRPQRLSAIANRSSIQTSLSSRRVSARASLRPSSPCFDEYQYWTTPNNVPLAALPENTECRKPNDELSANAAAPSPRPSILSAGSSASSPTSSHDRSSEAPSMVTSASTPSPRHQSFSKSADASSRSSLEHHIDEPVELKNESTRPEFKESDRSMSNSRHSSISILLDEYVHNGEQFMMSGALVE